MIDSRTETGKIEEEIRTTYGARKKKKENDLKYIFEGQSKQFKGVPSGRVWGNLRWGEALIIV